VQGTAETSAIAAAAADFPNQPADISGPGYVNSSTLLLLEWSGGDKVNIRVAIPLPMHHLELEFKLHMYTDRFSIISPLFSFSPMWRSSWKR
jgi:hypothetical protein